MSPHLTAPRSAQAHVNPPQALDRAPEAVRDRRGPPHDCRGVLLVPTTMRRLLPNLVRNERRAIEREGQAHTHVPLHRTSDGRSTLRRRLRDPELAPLPRRPGEHGQRVCLRVEHPPIKRHEVFVVEQKVHILQPRAGLGVRRRWELGSTHVAARKSLRK